MSKAAVASQHWHSCQEFDQGPAGKKPESQEMPRLVLIPGLLSDAAVWQPVADALASRLPIVIADVSMGESLSAMAGKILSENPGPLYVAGHSMGGRIALEMVRQASERIEKLALLDTGVHPPKEGEQGPRQVLVDLAFTHGMNALADKWLPPMVHRDRQSDPELMGSLRAMVLRADPVQHERQIRALLGRADAEPLLSQIACPVLLAVGRQDAWSPLSQHEKMLARLPDARLVVIEDAGHFAPFERPQATAEALNMWIDGWS
jgi:pimeloyl-ACP methyl ester carboxylesterase